MSGLTLNLRKSIRFVLIFSLPIALGSVLLALSRPFLVADLVELRYLYIVLGLLGFIFVVPILASNYIYNTYRSKIEFVIISQIASLSSIFYFIQINNQSSVSTTLRIFENFGLDLNLGTSLGLLILFLVQIFVHFDLLFGKYVKEFRLRFSTVFVLQVVLSLGFFSFLYARDLSNPTNQIYRSYFIELLVGTPVWVVVSVFAAISSLLTIFYFGRANVLVNPRPMWSKIAWRFLIFFIHFQIIGFISLLPQTYWWKSLFFILIWDFLVLPLNRIYKQKIDFFWEKLRLSIMYHGSLYLVLLLISPK
jgi:hypothetical protein